MRIWCHTVVRNEADRYWASWLDWHTRIFDGVHVYDDRSTDATASMAVDAGAVLSERAPNDPSFLDHEGKYRQNAWTAFEDAFKPEMGDWVFCIDADEFFVARSDEVAVLHEQCAWAFANHRYAFMVPIPEVFHTTLEDDNRLTEIHVRTDGFWGRIAGTRLFAYQQGGEFSSKAMGSGSEPTFVQRFQNSRLQQAWLMHYGYARPEDVQAKFARYSSLEQHGHAATHIASIVQDPLLAPWEGPYVDVYLGGRPEPGPARTAQIVDAAVVAGAVDDPE